MSLPMALVDFLPVGLFPAAAILLQRELYPLMSKGAFALFSAGTITVFVAGLFKGIWKLLMALSLCDFEALNRCFFPMQTVGFVLAACGVMAMLFHRQGDRLNAAPPVFAGTMIFVGLMVLGVLLMDLGLVILSVRRRRFACIPIFILSFVFVLGMGYLSSKDFADPAMNWAAEGVNTAGQGLFLLGAVLLRQKPGKAA